MSDSKNRRNCNGATVGSGTASIDAEAFQTALLTWYDKARRDLPWRAPAGRRADPYRVWLSEIMLQQTTVKAVIPYFEAFLARWPTVETLAAAPRDDVLAAWAGLGYYSRARNLHACAQALRESGFPETEDGLRRLPGVGAYTSAAIAAIAFNVKATVIDGNVDRVIARLFAIETPLPKAKGEIREHAADLTSTGRPGDYAQAMMDLGATVCTPKSPQCLLCPVRGFCKATETDPSRFPMKPAKQPRPKRCGRAFIVVATLDGAIHVLLRRRSDKGLLGGMFEPPNTAWETAKLSAYAASDTLCSLFPQTDEPAPNLTEAGMDSALQEADMLPRTDLKKLLWRQGGLVRHTFTHFELELDVSAVLLPENIIMVDAEKGVWVPVSDLGAAALPTVMLKAVLSGLDVLGVEHSYATAGRASSRRSNVSTVEASARPSTSAGRK